MKPKPWRPTNERPKVGQLCLLEIAVTYKGEKPGRDITAGYAVNGASWDLLGRKAIKAARVLRWRPAI